MSDHHNQRTLGILSVCPSSAVLQWPEPRLWLCEVHVAEECELVNLSSITVTSDHPASADQGYGGAKKVILGGSGGVPLVKRLHKL